MFWCILSVVGSGSGEKHQSLMTINIGVAPSIWDELRIWYSSSLFIFFFSINVLITLFSCFITDITIVIIWCGMEILEREGEPRKEAKLHFNIYRRALYSCMSTKTCSYFFIAYFIYTILMHKLTVWDQTSGELDHKIHSVDEGNEENKRC